MKSTMSSTTALLSAAAIAALLATAATPRVTADAPNGDNVDKKALFSQKCSACHNLPNPTELSYTRAEWRRTVDTMLTKYKASDEISPTEADQIVDYLATFAPHADNRPPVGSRQWSSEEDDVWFTSPNRTVITSFEGGTDLAGFTHAVDGDHAKPVWKTIADGDNADSTVARVTSAGADAGSFALLIDPHAKGADIDVKVRFKIVSGDTSPAVGIAVGVADSHHYDVIRYNRKTNDLSLIAIAAAVHTTVQSTPVNVDGGADPAMTVALDTHAAEWHTLRVQVKGGHIRGWVDSYKRINTTLPGYTGGSVALWTQGDTTAAFDDWSTDLYDPIPSTSPAS